MKKILNLNMLFIVCVSLLTQINTEAQQSKRTDKNDLLRLVKIYSKQLHISDLDAQTASISSSYTDLQTNIQMVYLQQNVQHLKIFNSIITIAFRNDSLLYSAGNFVENAEKKVSGLTPAVSPKNAVKNVAEYLAVKMPAEPVELENRFLTENKIIYYPSGIARRNIEAELILVTTDEGKTLQLAWNVNIDMKNKDDWWNIRIDAQTGGFISKDNWTVHEGQFQRKAQKKTIINCEENTDQQSSSLMLPPPAQTNATYKIVPFPIESPNHGAIANETNPWLKAGTGNNAISDAWHYDGTNNFISTQGNNVFAFEHTDTLIATGAPAISTTASPNLTFSFTPDFTKNPSISGSNNQNFAITNLFYWNNLMHDVMYQYGFDEPSGNYQNTNLGRGGLGGDFVNAQAQDGIGMDNANFSAPADGTSGRMRMYLWSAPPPTFTVNSPAAIAGNYTCTESNFSTANKLADVGTVTGQLVFYNDNSAGTTHFACGTPSNSIVGKIAVIMRGNCNFTVKVKDAQNAGAIAAVVINNVAATSLVIMSGSDNTITIPAVFISNADSATLISQLSNNVNVTLKSGGQNLDGDLDNGVICHEYGHGVSIRLTGGPSNSSCLNNAEEAGEGWSDYLGLMMTTNWATAQLTDGALPRPVATYAAGEPKTGLGIRLYPYSTDMTIDPHTYSDLAVSGEVHDIGETWCSALWDMTWNIINQTGTITSNIYQSAGIGGNVVALKLVMQGLKLQKCSPGFLDSRNAILAADSILFNKAYKCAIWNAFAKRGMGLSAKQGSSSNTSDQTAAFDIPSCTVVPLSLVKFSATLLNENKVLLDWLTANEINTNNFVLQRSIDGVIWTDIYSTPSNGQLSGSDYQFKDFYPYTGINYYRVKMIDADLSYRFSQIEKIDVAKRIGSNCYIVPNPAVNFTDIHFDQMLQSPKVFIYDTKGSLVHSEVFSGTINTCRLLTDKLMSGVYSVQIKSSTNTFATKLIVTHP